MTRHKIDGIPYDMEMIYLLQEGRQMEFPSDRIAFFRDTLAPEDEETSDAVWKIAEKDMDDMTAYEVGAIDLSELCKRIAKNNFLDRYFKGKGIPKEMMLNELKQMGYGNVRPVENKRGRRKSV